LVHAFFGFPTGWLCYRAAGRLPYVLSLRGSDVPGANARLKLDYKILGPLVFKPIWKKASALVACSEGLKARALQFLPSAQVDVIPNGVDLERFHPAQAGSGSRELRLLTVGRLSVTKRLPLLLAMVEDLRRQGVKAQLTVVGGGALEAELRQSLGERDLREAVTLLGRREGSQMPAIYRQHNVFVSASMQEGMSNAMLEAMASGLPIVTTRCEGVDELIGDNGIVVEDAQPQTLAAAVQKLGQDRAALRAMSIAARKKAETFGWDKVAGAYLELYAKVK
jgi:glycosyltransferase involved in cell wall biosynthesis